MCMAVILRNILGNFWEIFTGFILEVHTCNIVWLNILPKFWWEFGVDPTHGAAENIADSNYCPSTLVAKIDSQ